MLATSARMPEGERWAAEVKWDGLRGQLRHDGQRSTLRSRNGHDLSSAFPELVEEARRLLGRRPALLDAEIVCLRSDGRPDFSAVRARMQGSSTRVGARGRARLVVFDVLHVRGRSIRNLPYAARRSVLEELGVHGGRWMVPSHFVDQLADLVSVTREHRLEGVVFKRLDAPYAVGRRSPAWIKHKHRREERVVVLGRRVGDGRRPDAFVLGREGPVGDIRYAGEAAFGLTAEDRERIALALARRRATDRPVRIDVAAHGEPDGMLRDAIMLRVVA
jgi:bifunctional non-homologous end joining protein LigD